MNAFPAVTLPDVDQELAAEARAAASAGEEHLAMRARVAILALTRNPGASPRAPRSPRQAAAARKARKAARASRKANR